MDPLNKLPKPVKDVAARVITGLHRRIFDATNGAILGRAGGMPAVKLTTIGRKSGEARTVMLTTPTSLDGDLVLIASYGGDRRNPAWYLNLKANPEVEIVTAGDRYKAVARTASADEKAAIWQDVVASYKGYAAYQTYTDRDIPVVVCARVS